MAISAQPRKAEFQTQRKVPRVRYEREVLFKPLRGENQGGFVQDLSERGLFLIGQIQMSQGTEMLFFLPMEVGLHGKKVLCMVSGKVVRVDGRFSGPLRGYGIEFASELSRITKSQLQKYIAARPSAVL